MSASWPCDQAPLHLVTELWCNTSLIYLFLLLLLLSHMMSIRCVPKMTYCFIESNFLIRPETVITFWIQMTRLLAADSNYNHHLSDYTLVSYLYVNKKVEKTKHFRRRPRSFFSSAILWTLWFHGYSLRFSVCTLQIMRVSLNLCRNTKQWNKQHFSPTDSGEVTFKCYGYAATQPAARFRLLLQSRNP